LADTNHSAFIWSVADLLRGDYKQSDYGKVIIPFVDQNDPDRPD
jgi:type I restriction enzyme M protein